MSSLDDDSFENLSCFDRDPDTDPSGVNLGTEGEKFLEQAGINAGRPTSPTLDVVVAPRQTAAHELAGEVTDPLLRTAVPTPEQLIAVHNLSGNKVGKSKLVLATIAKIKLMLEIIIPTERDSGIQQHQLQEIKDFYMQIEQIETDLNLIVNDPIEIDIKRGFTNLASNNDKRFAYKKYLDSLLNILNIALLLRDDPEYAQLKENNPELLEILVNQIRIKIRIIQKMIAISNTHQE